jgi:hypothetical protein
MPEREVHFGESEVHPSEVGLFSEGPDQSYEGTAWPWGAGPSQLNPCTGATPNGYCPPGYWCNGGYCQQNVTETGYGPGGQITTNPPPLWRAKTLY